MTDNAHYLSAVLRAQPGQLVETYDGNGTVFRWRIDGISSKEVHLTFMERMVVSRKSPLKLTLGLNPLKGGNEEMAIRAAAAMEVAEIVPVFFRRSEVPIDFVQLERRLDRWARLCISEVNLSGGAYLPAIGKPATLSMFLRGDVDGVIFDEEADPDGGSGVSFPQGGHVVALVGPEGGLEREEVELARESGLKVASLGPWTLRAQLAGALVPMWVYSRAVAGGV